MDAVTFLNHILSACQVKPVSVDQTIDSGRATISLVVPEVDSGIFIGYHGETLDALQTLTSLVVNQDQSDPERSRWTPVMVDVNGYRQKRLQTLADLALRAADQAVESEREIILPPLTPFERRHVHLTLQPDTRVTTYSEGEASNRRLIVSPKKVAA